MIRKTTMLAGATAVLLSAGQALAAPAPASAFGRMPAIQNAAISPSGGAVALIGGSADQRVLTIAPVDSAKAHTVAAGKAETFGLRWAGDSHVVVSTTIYDRGVYPNGQKYQHHYHRDFVVDSLGKPVGPLFRQTGTVASYGLGQPLLRVVDGDKPKAIILALEFTGAAFKQSADDTRIKVKDRGVAVAVWRVNVENGQGRVQEVGAPGTIGFVVDTAGEARVRIDSDAARNTWRVMGRPKGGGGWRALRDQTTMAHDDLLGYSEPEDAAYFGVHDKAGHRIVRVSLKDGAQSDFAAPAGEGAVRLIWDEHTLSILGFAVLGEKAAITWTDPGMAAAFAKLQRAFAGKQVTVDDWSRDRSRLLVKVDTPDVPPTWYLYDIPRKELSPFGESYPELKSVTMGETRWITYKARDGLPISAYLTLPPGTAPGARPPLVVLPHGGPASRDSYDFDYLTQFIATRGYAVLRPQFRGSAGFGEAFERAGDLEWGGKMQTDLVDGVNHLAAQGLADPKRACIVGWSYGGYAALAGATLHPDTYRCAASINGVSDLPAMIGREARDFGGDSLVVAYWRKVIGDPRVQPAMLTTASPARQAAQAKIPVLLVHGRQDTTVPFDQSEKMQAALTAAGRPADFVAFDDDDHYLLNSVNRTAMLSAVETFLAKHNPVD